MEIGMKERLIGAVVLVLLGVILIPLFLKSSPSPDATVSETLTLPPADATGAAQYTLPLNAATTALTAAAVPATKPGASPAAVPSPPPGKPVVHPIPRPAAAAPAIASQPGGKWTVQAGSYGSVANADKIVNELKQHGIHATVTHFTKAGHTYYRVRVGSYLERSDADKAAALVAKAYAGKPEVVPND